MRAAGVGSYHHAVGSDSVDSIDQIREQAVGFFKLVRDFAKRQVTPKKDIGDFDSHLWFDDIPVADDCHVCTSSQVADENEEGREDAWIQITRRPEPECPQPDDGLHLWIEQEYPFQCDDDLTLKELILSSRISDQEVRSHGSDQPENMEYEHLRHHPEIEDAFIEYLNEFEEWQKEHLRWQDHDAIYRQLYSIHRALEREGELLELRVGMGLLTWRTPRDVRIRRHILTIAASMEYLKGEGTISIGPSASGLSIMTELEMLALEERPPHFPAQVDAAIETLRVDPWARETVDRLLTTAANEMASARGQFSTQLHPPETLDSTPRITFAPALILRKRTSKRMIERFDKIVKNLEQGGEIPENVRLLATTAQRGGEEQYPVPNDPGEVRSTDSGHDILFPLPANQEQYRIVEKFESGASVLVQGPPGTGKSHTIRNLICHLLAQGKRILVTAYADRALKVLRDDIPNEIRHLCLSVLGRDRAAMDELKNSVQVILARREDEQEIDPSRIERLSQERKTLKKERSRLDGKLKTLREMETTTVTIPGTNYLGTYQKIAARVRDEKEQFEWFDEVPRPEQSFPENGTHLLRRLVELCRKQVNHPVEPTEHYLPVLGKDGPSCEQLEELILRISEANKKMAQEAQGEHHPHARCLTESPPDRVLSLYDAVQTLLTNISQAEQRPARWISHALIDVLSDNDQPWKELRRTTGEHLECIEEKGNRIEHVELRLPEGIDRSRLRADAEDLREHLGGGGNLGIRARLFNKTIKRTRYVSQEVLVDGRPCDSIDRLDPLLEYLTVRRELEHIWSDWKQLVDEQEGPLWKHISSIKEHLEDLDDVLDVDRKMRIAKDIIRDIRGMQEPRWYNRDDTRLLLAGCAWARASHDTRIANEKIDSWESTLEVVLRTKKRHSITGTMRNAIQSRALGDYRDACRKLELFHEGNRLNDEINLLMDQLAEDFPNLTNAVVSSPLDQTWDERINTVEDAWNRARANAWVLQYLEEQQYGTITKLYNETVERIDKCTEELASILAWHYCLKKMGTQEARYLEAWRLKVRKIGKGTGKSAPRLMREAEELLAPCRGSIPAWILPLYRLYEQIDPEPEMFDVIIVDEASQCPIESLILLYLGKKIIVVGDDEQISPTRIGVPDDEFKEMLRKHLHGNLLATAIEKDTSLFDLAKIWFGQPLTLREHFRCMPEIISFSNKLCYANRPLIPLTQYGADRLEPIKTIHEESGYVRGSGGTLVNEPEAERVVTEIVRCCKDDRYEGMTMGVISLTGDKQARTIEGMLHEALDPDEIEQRQLVCGNAYSFQGDERDVMFLSLVAARQDEHGLPRLVKALTSRTDKQRFNVAASRARKQMWLFHSVTLDDLRNEEDMRRKLLAHCLSPGDFGIEGIDLDYPQLHRLAEKADRQLGNQPEPFGSWFEVDVCLAIAARGYRVRPQYHFAGRDIDLVVFDGSRKLAVECYGDYWHGGEEQFEKDQTRQHQLERAGWIFSIIWESAFRHDPEESLLGLWQELEHLGIRPMASVSQEERSDDSAVTQDEDTQESPALPRMTDDVARVESSSRTAGPQAYQRWVARKVPNPSTAPVASIVPALVEIVLAESPILKERAVNLYRKAAGIGRVGSILRPKFDSSVDAAVRKGLIEQRTEPRRDNEVVQVLWAPGTPRVVLREAGDRAPNEIPPSELAALMSEVLRTSIPMDDASLFRNTCEYLGISRLRSSTRELLESVLRLLRAGEWADDL